MFRRNLLAASAAVMATLSLTGVAYAQTSDKSSSESSSNSSSSSTVETVTVTATGTNISGIAPVGSESLTVDRDQILSTGRTSLGDLFNVIPQVSGASSGGGGISTRQGGTSGYGAAGAGGADATQTTAVNLRGIGAQATLTLVDGHRVAQSGATNIYTEINQIPVAAIQRVEVILDGNSAIYGSDAIGGVINLVTRKDYNGIEATGRATFVDGYNEYGGSVTAGHSWDHIAGLGAGNIIVSFDYDYRQAMLNSARGYLAQDLRRYGGLDNRVPSGSVNGGVGPGQPSNNASPGPNGDVAYCDVWNASTQTCGGGGVAPSYVYFGLPSGSDGTGLTTGSLTDPTFSDNAKDTTYLGKQLRYQGAGFFNQDITNWLSIYVDAFYTHRELNNTQSQGGNFGLTINQVCAPSFGVACNGFYFPVPYNNPLYIAPPTAPSGSGYTYGGPMTILYDSTDHGHLVSVRNPDENYTFIGGVKVDLPFEWNGEMSMTYSRDNTCGECQIGTNLDGSAFNYQVDEAAMALAGDPISSSAPINPLSNANLTAAQLSEVYGTNIQLTTNRFTDFVAKANGPLFDLPGGTVRAAVGGEFQFASELVQNGANRSVIPPSFAIFGGYSDPVNGVDPLIDQGYGYLGQNGDTSGVGCTAPKKNCAPRSPSGAIALNQFAWDNIAGKDHHIMSAFAELYIPVIGEKNGIPLVQSFNIDAAVRYDHYSDVGDTTNPKVAATWQVNDDLKFRGSWGTSFRAPSLADDNPYVFSYKLAYQGSGTNNVSGLGIPTGPIVALILGGQPSSLQPETATNWSVGADYSPHWLDGFKTSATFYSIDYSNQIAGFPGGTNFLGSDSAYALYKNYVTIIHQPGTCNPNDPNTFDPAFLPAYNAFGLYGSPYYLGVSPCQVQAVLDERTTNLATTQQQGIDFDANYNFESSAGIWDFDLSGTTVVKDTITTVPGAAPQSVLGKIYYQQRWKGRGEVSWSQGPWLANLFMNYVGDYQNNVGLAGKISRVPAWVTFDASVTYSFDDLDWEWAKGTHLQLSAQNLFDRDPPIVLTSLGSAYDPTAANVYGRIVSINLTKDF